MTDDPASSKGRTPDFGSGDPCSSQGAGTIFPPRDIRDIFAYDISECVLGFQEYQPHIPDPGDEFTPSYRWGWANAKFDRTREDDGFLALRLEAQKAFHSLEDDK